VTQSSVTVCTSDWDPRSVRFLLARGVTFNPDGSLSYWDAATEEFAQRTRAVHEEVANGTFRPNWEIDQLTRALGNKEHPGHTRGFLQEEHAQKNWSYNI